MLLQRAVLALALLAFSGAAAAQAPAPRGTVPPGSAADGSRPADGAITGGVPDRLPIEKRVERCNELSGALRDQCLRDAMNSGSGASRTPGASATKPRPPDAPPPQNPR